MKTLYVSDLDGTLLGPDSRISPRSLGILTELIEGGLMFTYATARSYASARIVTSALRVSAPAITYNGAMLVDTRDGRVLSSLRHSPAVTAAVRALAVADDAPLPYVYSIVGGRERVSYRPDRMSAGMERYLASRPGDGRFRAVEDGDALFEGEAFYFTFIDSRARLEPIYRRVRELDCLTSLHAYPDAPDEYWLEMMPRGATKARAIEQLRRDMGFERVVCFGDFHNDASMFRAADEAYAVGNAEAELKALATAVIGDNAHDGVAEFLQKRILGAHQQACVQHFA